MNESFCILKEIIKNSIGWQDVFNVLEGNEIKELTHKEQFYLQEMVNNSECNIENKIVTDYGFERGLVCSKCGSPNLEVDHRFGVGCCMDCDNTWSFDDLG